MPRPVEALPCGSRSMIKTSSPMAASAVPRLIAVVVLPTPPFWLATASTRGGLASCTCGARSGAAKGTTVAVGSAEVSSDMVGVSLAAVCLASVSTAAWFGHSFWLSRWSNSRYTNHLGFRIGKTRRQRRLDAPTFSGLGQFGIYILTLGKQTERPGFQQRIRGGQQPRKGRQRPCRHNVHRCREVFDKIFEPDRVDLSGSACGMDCFAQEGRLLGAAFDQVD